MSNEYIAYMVGIARRKYSVAAKDHDIVKAVAYNAL